MGERPWTRQDLAGLMASPGMSGFLLRAGEDDAGRNHVMAVDDGGGAERAFAFSLSMR